MYAGPPQFLRHVETERVSLVATFIPQRVECDHCTGGRLAFSCRVVRAARTAAHESTAKKLRQVEVRPHGRELAPKTSRMTMHVQREHLAREEARRSQERARLE